MIELAGEAMDAVPTQKNHMEREIMYTLIFYVPESDLEQVKNALFAKGAGRIGNYECCAWQVKGQGQFKPLSGSHPSIGQVNQLQYVEEYRVEMVVEAQFIHTVITELKAVHPYEKVVYSFYRVEVDGEASASKRNET